MYGSASQIKREIRSDSGATSITVFMRLHISQNTCRISGFNTAWVRRVKSVMPRLGFGLPVQSLVIRVRGDISALLTLSRKGIFYFQIRFVPRGRDIMRDGFADYHPSVNFIYFALVTGFALALQHPLAQGISLVCALAYALSINGRKVVPFLLRFCLPTVLLTAVINPLFNHKGVTELLSFPNGNPLTLESILYGVSAGAVLVAVLMWFSSFNRVMTTDKFIYLFGRIIPALSLVLSMSLRFIPRFKAQLQSVTEAQRSIGRDVSKGSVMSRIKTATVIFSVMITWSLENAIETADSMKSRGYGLKGRTTFSPYRFERRDKYALVWLCLCGIILITGAVISVFDFSFFPEVIGTALTLKTTPFYFVHFSLCITPVAINLKEEIKWKTTASKM